MAKKKRKTVYTCQACGYESPQWYGKCPQCGAWNTLEEEVIAGKPIRQAGTEVNQKKAKPERLKEVSQAEEKRVKTGLGEFNRVLGGGVVPGSLVLIGGDPGIGKSTLLLQVAKQLSDNGGRVLYVSGEESLHQIKMRADRLGYQDADFFVYAETDLLAIEAAISDTQADFVVIDSIQTMVHPNNESLAGSVSQVREATGELMHIAKSSGIAIFVVGHVTKEGNIAGPRILEHMVDTVLYLEGGETQHLPDPQSGQKPFWVDQ